MRSERLIAEADSLTARLDDRRPPVRMRKDLAALDDVLSRARGGALPAATVAKLLSTKARTLWAGGELEAAGDVFEDLIARYSTDADRLLGHEVDFALMSTGQLYLADPGERARGLDAFDHLLRRVQRQVPADAYAPYKLRMLLDLAPLLLGIPETARVVAICETVRRSAGAGGAQPDVVAEATFLQARALAVSSPRLAEQELHVLHHLGGAALTALDRLRTIEGLPQTWTFEIDINRAAVLAHLGYRDEARALADSLVQDAPHSELSTLSADLRSHL